MAKLINNTDYPEQYVYHYTSSTTAIDYILNNGTLLFNTFDRVNDPRENKDWEFTLLTPVHLDYSLERDHELSSQASSLLKKKAKMICFSLDDQNSLDMSADNVLSRGFSKPALWHHYGNKHDGVCLMFDRKKLDTAFRHYLASDGLVCDAVEYSNTGFLPKLGDDPFVLDLQAVSDLDILNCMEPIKKHFFRYYRELFFRKLENWSSESEIRWIYFDSTVAPKLVKYHDALVGILVGDTVCSEKICQIYDYSRQHDVCFQQITWRNGFPYIQSPEIK